MDTHGQILEPSNVMLSGAKHLLFPSLYQKEQTLHSVQSDICGDTRGFTLIEVLMTVVIIGILAAVAMRSVQSSIDGSRIRETQAEMDELIVAIAGNPDLYNNGMRADFGYVGDVGAVPGSIDDLVTNPGGYTTWNGPYVRRRFAQDADGFKKDAWGNSYAFSNGITLNSTGGGSTAMTKSAASAAADLTTTPINGTITDAAGNPPGDSSVAVTISLVYPDGAGSTTTTSINPTAGGSFTINSIPVGARTLKAVYRATADTVTTYAALLPKTGATVTMRLPGAPFAGIAAGAGGGSGSIEFVFGSATSPSNDVQFSVWNTGSSPITVTTLKADYATVAYYSGIRWSGAVVFNSPNPRAASGQVVAFSSGQALNAGQSAVVLLDDFRAAISGGAAVQLNNVVLTIQLSDGSTMALNSN